jgi:hypothetical protein
MLTMYHTSVGAVLCCAVACSSQRAALESERSHLLQLRQAVAADLANLKTKEDRWVTKQQQRMGRDCSKALCC